VKIPDWVKIGKNYKIDDMAFIGYRPSRSISGLELIIGKNAHIRNGTVIYAGSKIGNNLETGHGVVIREENTIGENLDIWSNSIVDYGCKIGDNVKIHCNVYLAQFTEIENDVFLAPGVTIVNDPHPICTECMKGPIIKKGARIGANVTLLSHIVVGKYSLIGAGSVVTKDIPPRSLAYGNPARIIKSVDELKCPLGIVGRPYKDGRDVRSRKLTLDENRQEGKRK